MNALASYLDIFVWVELQLYINSYNCQLNEKIRIKKLDTLLRQIMKSIYMICFQHNTKQAIILPSHIYYFVHEKLLRSNQIETYTKLKLIQKYISALDYCEYSDLFKNCNLLAIYNTRFHITNRVHTRRHRLFKARHMYRTISQENTYGSHFVVFW